tara:strand:- start:845 stop:1105 length:261 start_codon:yes stop_codon:yes gene_type:complete
MKELRVQTNRGCSRPVVAVCLDEKAKELFMQAIYFTSVRSCAKYLNRNPAAVTKVCQGAWHTCNSHKVYYEEDYEKKFGKPVKVDW